MGKPLKKSDGSKPWVRRNTPRKARNQPERRYFLIVCEGAKTEPNYFEAFRAGLPKGTVQVEIYGEGMNTLSLVDRAGDIRDRTVGDGRTVDKLWVVFDRDSFLPDDFDNAIFKAGNLKYGEDMNKTHYPIHCMLP